MANATHRCPVGDCRAAVHSAQLMRPRHWRLVPSPLKRALYRAWQGGASAGSTEHQQATRACIEAAHASCEPGLDQNLRQIVRRFLAGYRHPNHINGESWDEEDVTRLIRSCAAIRTSPTHAHDAAGYAEPSLAADPTARGWIGRPPRRIEARSAPPGTHNTEPDADHLFMSSRPGSHNPARPAHEKETY